MQIFYEYLRYEFLTAVLLKIQVVCIVRPYRLVNSHRPSETSTTIYRAIGVTSIKT